MESPYERAEWNNIAAFIVVAEVGSFAKAAEQMRVGINTVRRSVQRLEDQVGFSLFYREVEGTRLTPEGRRLINAARDVQSSVRDLWRVASTTADTMAGPIRLAVTEGIGAFWLMPQLVRYLDDLNGLNRVELQCAMRSVDVLRLEAEISVQLVEPTNPNLIVRRLGYLHLVPWASAAYLERFGRPKTFADLANHRIVEQEADPIQPYDLDVLFGPGAAERMVLLKTNFSSGHYWAVLNGGGIGIMPSYAKMIGGLVEHVDIGFKLRTGIWMACHPEVLKSERHRKFVDWLAEAFSAQRYPWFGEDYVSPEEIERQFDRSALRDYFNGFVGRG